MKVRTGKNGENKNENTIGKIQTQKENVLLGSVQKIWQNVDASIASKSVTAKVKLFVLHVLQSLQNRLEHISVESKKQPSMRMAVQFVPAAEIITLNLCPSITSAVVVLRTDGSCVEVMDTQGVVEYASISGSRGIIIRRDIECSVETATVRLANSATALTNASA